MTMSHVLCLLFFFSSILMKSNGRDPCPPRECNGVLIKYPFWQLDETTSEQFCGYLGFGLNCSDNSTDPVLKLPKTSYSVHEIHYDNSTLKLIDTDVAGEDCPRAQQNFTVQTLPIYQTPFDLNLTFYYNCSSAAPLPPMPAAAAARIDCLESKPNISYVVETARVESTLPPFDDHWYEFCEDKVDVAVMKNEIVWDYVGMIREFRSSALNEGFLVQWETLKDCIECEKSEGRCGYNNTSKEFVCFCKDNMTITTDNQHCKGKQNKTGVIIGAVVAGVVGVGMFLLLVALILYRRKKLKRGLSAVSSAVSLNVSSYSFSMSDSEKGGGTYMGVPIFSYNELEKATDNFDTGNELGDGGFGTVYKGKLQDGREVAVKRLYENSFKRVEQFMNEIAILAKLRHPNLVVLYGSTSHECQKLLLVYEYIPNGTIADHLYEEDPKPGNLTWKTRMSIAVETASALSYLHLSKVIHRDVKTTNILLDDNFHVKVADFGLSRLFPHNFTHVSTAPQGTPGYVDPEYHQCYQLTAKSDVYSFGVVLIELISSKPAVDVTRHRHEINLANLAINKIQGDALHELVDPSLGFESDYEIRNMIMEVAELAFRCLQNDRELRPSMDEVHTSLKEIQSQYYGEKTELEDSAFRDDALLLKNHPQNHSPDSVTVKWVSKSTNSSSCG